MICMCDCVFVFSLVLTADSAKRFLVWLNSRKTCKIRNLPLWVDCRKKASNHSKFALNLEFITRWRQCNKLQFHNFSRFFRKNKLAKWWCFRSILILIRIVMKRDRQRRFVSSSRLFHWSIHDAHVADSLAFCFRMLWIVFSLCFLSFPRTWFLVSFSQAWFRIKVLLSLLVKSQ